MAASFASGGGPSYSEPADSPTSAAASAAPISAAALSVEADGGVFSCRRCRGPLFRGAHITAHAVGAHRFSRHRLNKDAASGCLASPRADADVCTSYFLAEALQWMRSASEGVEGKLHCPHCTSRVGTLRWAGAQCSCGTWVTPAVQIARKAVDPPLRSQLLQPAPSEHGAEEEEGLSECEGNDGVGASSGDNEAPVAAGAAS